MVTGTGMGKLMPMVLPLLEEHTGGSCELIVLDNELFGPRVTTAGLLPGAAFCAALRERSDLDIVLLPAEAVNDADLFIDDMPLATVIDAVPAHVHCSYDFVDVLSEVGG